MKLSPPAIVLRLIGYDVGHGHHSVDGRTPETKAKRHALSRKQRLATKLPGPSLSLDIAIDCSAWWRCAWIAVFRAGSTHPTSFKKSCLVAAKQIASYAANPTMPFYLWLRWIAGQKLIDQHRRHLGAEARRLPRSLALSWSVP